MDSRVEAFFDSVRGKRITFCGVGVSNAPLVEMFGKKGAKVTVCDRRSREQLGELGDRFEQQGVTLCLGDGYLDHLDADIIFRTPGMRFFMPELNRARRDGMAVTSELEVFFDLCPCPIYAVTGSDGKTTTTTVIAKMLEAQGKRVHLGGNIGRALLPLIEEIRPDDVAVVELSSFQLISMRRSPKVAVITNITPNHLDMHKDMAEYVNAKKNIFLHQNAFGKAVFNADNEITASFCGEARGQVLQFSRRHPVEAGAWLREDGMLMMTHAGTDTELFPAAEIRIPGNHNIENYLTAITAVWGDVSVENMRRVAQEFPGVEHRAEFVRELDGVRYYNDSIATTPSRTISGTLSLFDRKIILIAGGYDKKVPFAPLGPVVAEKVKTLILLGVTAPKIEAAVTGCAGYRPGCPEIIHVENLEQAVKTAHEIAGAGDIVSLSPACASFDQFPNFETRGEKFKEYVRAL
ncbi:MAG: UDP-N-acetylmuramoyl-L-alanine--D-glutamate ligase [Firmicutes bacterium]|nr:UDP-N-acetylmuramoyl-L-alanine--D-glutamate ligase [Bacillota bacterium]